MKQSSSQLWDILLREGLVHGETPAAGRTDSPWYVKALLGFSGWLAALFMLGFIGIGLEFVVRSSIASLVTGSLMVSCAFAVLRIPKNEFLEHLALAVSLAGQALVVYAIFKLTGRNDQTAWILITFVQIGLALVMPNFLHGVFSSSFAAFAFFMALVSLRWPYLASSLILFCAVWFWLNEFRYPVYMKKIRAIGYGLVLALVVLKGLTLFDLGIIGWRFVGPHASFMAQPWVSEVITGGVLFYVAIILHLRNGLSLSSPLSIAIFLGIILLSAVSLEARGIIAGITIILLGFSGGNRILTGLGIASLLFYISTYYYQLDLTLLDKSKSLLIIGLFLLAGRWLLLRLLSLEQEAEHVS